MNRQNLAILGSTGTIGVNTLDVVARHGDQYNVVGLSGFTQMDRLLEQIRLFQPDMVAVKSQSEADLLGSMMKAGEKRPRLLTGAEGLDQLVTGEQVDMVMAGIVGAAGLLPTLAAVQAGKKVLVANKEPLVMMGREFMRSAQESGAVILPIDSEHNAIFQSLPQAGADASGVPARLEGVKRLLLTGSGGPFRDRAVEDMGGITPEQAVAHPNWVMGRKISVDSATMMNKGLELIEACSLFDVRPDQIDIVVHPQSIIHSMVEYTDGSVIAQLGMPDMRTPIAHALAWPQRLESGVERLDFFRMNQLNFEPPDPVKFPCLRLARTAAEQGGLLPAVLNAANEEAVSAFLDRRLAFTGIAEIVERVMDSVPLTAGVDLEAVLQTDQLARTRAGELIEKMGVH